ncbi:MAG: tryptophan synthase subunit alpha, partial [Gemmatimonadota bacterium]
MTMSPILEAGRSTPRENDGARVPGARIESAIRKANEQGRPALTAFLTAGYPSREGFVPTLRSIAAVVDVVEIGVPFSDPMAD